MAQKDEEIFRQAIDKAHAEGLEQLVQKAAYGWDKASVYILSGVVIAFALCVMGIMAYLIDKKDHNPNVILRTFTIPLIAVLAVLLIIVGYTQQQIAPAIGLLGTIAGFLLNRSDSRDRGTGGEGADGGRAKGSTVQGGSPKPTTKKPRRKK